MRETRRVPEGVRYRCRPPLQSTLAHEGVVRELVESGMPVYEIAPDQESLETFYLGLMNGKPQGDR